MTPVKSKRGKLWRRLLAGLFLCAAAYIAGLLALIWQVGANDAARESELIIVLGAGLRRDGRPGAALTRRSLHGAALWHAGMARRVLCTGGRAESQPRAEADACRELLLASGLPDEAILLEARSRSTEENALHSVALMRGLGLRSATLATDHYHMLRASWLFRRQGIDIATSAVPASRAGRVMFYPYALREIAALHWQVLKDALGLPQTHLAGL